MAIYYLWGPDDFSLQTTVRRLLRAAFPADAADLNTTRLAGGEVRLDALRFACGAAPFLAERGAVVVDGLFARLGRVRSRSARGERGGARREGAEPAGESGAADDGAAPAPAGDGGLGAAL